MTLNWNTDKIIVFNWQIYLLMDMICRKRALNSWMARALDFLSFVISFLLMEKGKWFWKERFFSLQLRLSLRKWVCPIWHFSISIGPNQLSSDVISLLPHRDDSLRKLHEILKLTSLYFISILQKKPVLLLILFKLVTDHE